MVSRSWPGTGAVFPLVFVAWVVAYLSIVLGQRIFPFVDLPHHLAAATLLRFQGESTNSLSDFYALDLSIGPNLFHAVFTAWSGFPSVEFANKLYLSSYVVLFPLSILYFVQRIGGSKWVSLLSLLFVFNFNVSWGFVGYFGAIPLVVAAYTFSIDCLVGSRPWRRWALAAMMVILFFVHVQAALLSAVLFCVYIIDTRGFQPLRWIRDALPVVPLCALTIYWWSNSDPRGHGSMFREVWEYASLIASRGLSRRSFILYQDNSALRADVAGEVLGALFALVVVVPAIAWLVRHRSKCWRRSADESTRAIRVLGGVSLVCLLLLPSRLGGQDFILHRYSVFLYVAAIAAASLLPLDRFRDKLAVPISGLLLVHFLLWADYFRTFDREIEPFSASFLEAFVPDSRLAAIIDDPFYRGHPVYIHFQNYYIVWHQGVASTRAVDYRFRPFDRRVGTDLLPEYDEWPGLKGDYDGRYEGMELLLVRGEFTAGEWESFSKLSLLRRSGAWSLYTMGRP